MAKKGLYEEEYLYSLEHKDKASCAALLSLAELYAKLPESYCLSLIQIEARNVREIMNFSVKSK